MKVLWIIVFTLLLASTASAQAVDRPATWTDTSNNETNMVVESCPGTCTAASTLWKQIAKLPANTASFLITGAPVNSTTSYRVGAQNAMGTGYSTIFVDAIPDIKPTAPTVFTLPPCKLLTETAPGSGLYQCS